MPAYFFNPKRKPKTAESSSDRILTPETKTSDLYLYDTCLPCVDNCKICGTTTQCEKCHFLFTLSEDKTFCENDTQVISIILFAGIILGLFCSCCMVCLFEKLKSNDDRISVKLEDNNSKKINNIS